MPFTYYATPALLILFLILMLILEIRHKREKTALTTRAKTLSLTNQLLSDARLNLMLKQANTHN